MDSHHLAKQTPPEAGVFARVARAVQQFLCGLRGHDALLHFEEGRILLQCSSCGYESPGWEITPAQAQQSHVVESTPRVVRMPLVRQRRVA
jgi:hypothetical protein